MSHLPCCLAEKTDTQQVFVLWPTWGKYLLIPSHLALTTACLPAIISSVFILRK